MSIAIWFFSFSLAFIILMVIYRGYELSSGKILISSETRSRYDRFILDTFDKVFVSIRNHAQSLIQTLTKIPHQINELLHSIWRIFSDKVDRYFEKLRGRRDIGKKGSVSLYWQQIEKKSDGSKGS